MAAHLADVQVIADALAAALGPLVTALTPVVPAVVAAPVATKFAFTPAQARSCLLDYELPGDAEIYYSVTQKLATVFSLTKPNVTVLLAELGDRAYGSAWQKTIEVTIGASAATANQPAFAGTKFHLINDYGQTTIEQLRITAEAYQVALQRDAQNDYQLYTCLANSVDEATKTKLQHEKATYMVGANRDVASGILYFKLLMNKAEVNSRAKASRPGCWGDIM